MAEEYLEDYLSFIKESERLKTVLRHPVRPVDG